MGTHARRKVVLVNFRLNMKFASENKRYILNILTKSRGFVFIKKTKFLLASQCNRNTPYYVMVFLFNSEDEAYYKRITMIFQINKDSRLLAGIVIYAGI